MGEGAGEGQRTGVTDACDHLDCGMDRIDRFFFRSNEHVQIEPTAWRVATEFVDSAGKDLSDHNAIHVSFRWSRK